jgi:hypothetical protein
MADHSAALTRLKPDLDEAEKRWLAFWDHELIDRPCCIMRAPKDGAEPVAGPPYMAGARDDFGPIAEQVLASARAVYWGGEAIPSYTPSFGPDMFAAWLGAELTFPEQGYGTSWATPCIEDWNAALPLRLDPDNYWWRRMLDFCGTLSDVLKGEVVVTHVDMHSNLDALLALRGGMGLCTDLIDVPEQIDRAMADVRALYRDIDQGLRTAGSMTPAMGWLPIYHPQRTNVVQCDFGALIGPEHFQRWALPALAEEAAYLGHCIMHYDGPEMLVHLDGVCAIKGIDCIQWQPGVGNKPFVEWMDLLQRIQSQGVAVYISCSAEDVRTYHRQLKPELVCYYCSASSQHEADQTLQWLVDHT